MICETIRVVSPVTDENPHGYIVINKSDLTEEHQVYAPPKEGDAKTDKPAKTA